MDVVVGTVVAFVTGILAIAWLLRFLRTRSTLVFVVYRLLLGGPAPLPARERPAQPAAGVRRDGRHPGDSPRARSGE